MEKLKNVIDPELFVNVVDLGLIYGVKLKEGVAGAAAAAPGATAGSSSSVASGATADLPSSAVEPAATAEPAAPPTGPITDVFIEMTMTSPACPAGPQLIGGAKREVASLPGVGNVEVKIVLDPPWTPDRMTEDAKDQLGIF
ncbi:MAG: metal-sulfur cluster assembly factor [Planctomycetia bacterium]|nr:metal-sulfur cluster assembly factor [Planctomycetia bacterium]